MSPRSDGERGAAGLVLESEAGTGIGEGSDRTKTGLTAVATLLSGWRRRRDERKTMRA